MPVQMRGSDAGEAPHPEDEEKYAEHSGECSGGNGAHPVRHRRTVQHTRPRPQQQCGAEQREHRSGEDSRSALHTRTPPRPPARPGTVRPPGAARFGGGSHRGTSQARTPGEQPGRGGHLTVDAPLDASPQARQPWPNSHHSRACPCPCPCMPHAAVVEHRQPYEGERRGPSRVPTSPVPPPRPWGPTVELGPGARPWNSAMEPSSAGNSGSASPRRASTERPRRRATTPAGPGSTGAPCCIYA